MNKVMLIGRLTADPTIRYTQGQNSQAVANYRLAVDRRGKQRNGEDSADFINCVAWNQGAEFAEKYLHKGTKIAIVGHIQTGKYTDKNGNTVYTTDVVVEQSEFCESKGQNVSQQQDQQQTFQPQPQQAPQPQQQAFDGFMSIPDGIDEELPFN